PAHAFYALAGDHPVGEIAALGDLHGAEDGEVDVAAADHGEGVGGGEDGCAGQEGDGLLAGVDEVGVDLGVEWIGAHAEQTVFRLKDNRHAGRDAARAESGHADAEVHVEAVLQFARGALGHLLPGPSSFLGHRLLLPDGAANCSPFNALLGVRIVDEALDEDAGCVNLVGVELAGLDDDLGLGDRDAAAGGDVGVEVARGAAVDKIAVGVGFPGLHQREVGVDGALQQILMAVELAHLFAFGDLGANAGARVEAGDAGSAGAHAFGECALRCKLDFDLAGEELALELGILANVAGDHLAYLAGLEQEAKAPAVDAGVVARDGEVARAGGPESEDESFGDSAKAEAADGNEHAVTSESCERRFGAWIEFVHAIANNSTAPHYAPAAAGMANQRGYVAALCRATDIVRSA